MGSQDNVHSQTILKHDGGRPRILLFSMTPFYGGGEAYYVKLAKLLLERYELAAVVADKQLYEQFVSLKINTQKISDAVSGGAVYRYAEAISCVARAIRTFRPNCIHLNGQAECYLAIIPALFRIPAVSTRHTSFDEKVAAYKRFAVAQNLKLVRMTVCVSSQLKEQLAARVNEQRLVTIPNWMDPLPEVLPLRLPHAGETFRLLYIGRIVRDKGIFELLDAMRDVADGSLDVVGEGADSAEVGAYARGLPITFHGFQTDCSPFYRRSHLLVFPSHWEGQPFVPIEAMAHGLPCLLSNIPVNQETADHGRAAELFQCGNVADLVGKIRALQVDPKRLLALSERGVERVRLQYTKERARDQYFKVFDHLIGKL
jgi:glycosyltransferase involved in cell wall biosynthesis